MNAKKTVLPSPQLIELLYQALESEQGGVLVYRQALQCVHNEVLEQEWESYLAQTEEHVLRLTEVLTELGLDPDAETPGRQCVRTIGTALVRTMQLALGSDSPMAAELVAAEAVVLAETKDHMNWSLLSQWVAKDGSSLDVLVTACGEVEAEEDEHLYHSQGWARELWLKSLDLPAQLPPPEEEQEVQSELEAAEVRARR
jgi:rubrerythrin